jgi:hypothetical protein
MTNTPRFSWRVAAAAGTLTGIGLGGFIFTASGTSATDTPADLVLNDPASVARLSAPVILPNTSADLAKAATVRGAASAVLAAPVTVAPVTVPPATVPPATVAPTTVAPTTAAPAPAPVVVAQAPLLSVDATPTPGSPNNVASPDSPDTPDSPDSPPGQPGQPRTARTARTAQDSPDSPDSPARIPPTARTARTDTDPNRLLTPCGGSSRRTATGVDGTDGAPVHPEPRFGAGAHPLPQSVSG